MSRLWLNNLFLWVEEHLCQEPQAPLPLARIFEGLQHSIAHIPGLQKGEEAHVDWKWLAGLVYAGTGGKKAKSRQRSGSTFAALSDLGRCDMNRPFVIYSLDMNCLTGPIVWGCARCVWRPCFALDVSTPNRQDLRKEVGKSKIRKTIWSSEQGSIVPPQNPSSLLDQWQMGSCRVTESEKICAKPLAKVQRHPSNRAVSLQSPPYDLCLVHPQSRPRPLPILYLAVAFSI